MYGDIPGKNKPSDIKTFDAAGIGIIKNSGYKVPTLNKKNAIPIITTNREADLEAKIKVQELKILDLKENMKRNVKRAKKREHSVLKKLILVQEQELEKSLEALKAKDPKMNGKLVKVFKALKSIKLLKENVKVQEIEIKKTLPLMELGWRRFWSKNWSKHYYFNIRTGKKLWSLMEVQAVHGCSAPQGEYLEETDVDEKME